MNQNVMHRQRQLLLIAAGLGVISIFLPWVKMDVGGFLQGMGVDNSLNGLRGMGILVFINFLVTGFLAFMGEQEKPLDKTPWLIVLIAGVLSVLATGAFILRSEKNMQMGMGLIDVSIGAGAMLAVAAAALSVAGAWIFKKPGYSIRDSWETIAKNKLPAFTRNTHTETKTVNMDDLEKLVTMRNEGTITEEEYQRLKSELFSNERHSG
jgi:hypothetical protein